MLRAFQLVAFAVSVSLLCGCAGFIDRYFPPLVSAQEIAEITVAIRKVTRSPIILCTRPIDSQSRGPIYVTTAEHKDYTAIKWRGKWYFHEVVIVGSSPHLTMRWSERLAALVPYSR